MGKRLRWAAIWVLPIIGVCVYAALLLTNAKVGDFFVAKAWGSNLYANAWVHIRAGNFLIDPQYVPGEYFIVGPGKYVAYFGIMPALIRGVGDIFLKNIYAYNLTNLSMVCALVLGIGSVGYAVYRLVAGHKKLYVLGGSIVLALLLASPLNYLLAWSWTYHEVILWGLAWSLLFVSVYTLWIFEPKQNRMWHGLLMGLAAGMAVLCRPTIALTLLIPYAYLCLRSLWDVASRHDTAELRKLLAGMIVAAALLASAGYINYQRWGSPLTFVELDRNVQIVTLFPERGRALKAAGEFNPNRLPTSLAYYGLPTAANFKASFPFVTLDSKLTLANHAPQYDYIEGSRLPLILSMPYLIFLAVLGIYGGLRLRRDEKFAGSGLLIGGLVTAATLLTVYAVALRYSGEFLPALVFLALVYIVALKRKLVSPPKQWLALSLAGVFVASVYITAVTTLAYKEFVWDIPTATRQQLRTFLHYTPTSKDTKHIINGVRFPVY